MKKTRSFFLLSGILVILWLLPVKAYTLPVLTNANQLAGPVFVQPFAGLTVVSEIAGVGSTDFFFSNLPDGSPVARPAIIRGHFHDSCL